MLTSVYQKYKPEKLSEIDHILAKYQGREEVMFRLLAQKYNIDLSVFGLSPAPATPQAPSFGGSSFGQASPLGGGPVFGSSSSSMTPGTGSGGGFAQYGGNAQSGGFGSLSQQSGGGFSSFGGGSSPFGSATPFGGPRR